MPYIIIHATCDDLEAAQAILDSLGANASSYEVNVTHSEPEMDLTPPHGIERPDAIDLHVAALVAWTYEHITEGPLTMVSDEVLRTAFRRLLDDGHDATLGQLDLTDIQMACIRGAFRDATAVMVKS